jgi:uncharacterized protein YndB with AHSA1/START domain
MAASNAHRVFELTRRFDQPRARLWKAWSEPEQLLHWWGPKGCAIQVLRLEFRPGGFFHYSMKSHGASMTWGRFMYREITALERLVWLNSFANQDCGIARAPFSEHCPLEIQNAVTFEEQGKSTLITLRAEPFGALETELSFFVELCSSGGLAQGYGGTFDQLAEHVAKM